MNRIEYIDKIKGVSICLVVFCHYTLLSDSSFCGNVIMIIAWGAVPCFFMTTGAILNSTSTFKWKKYIIRMIRIYLVLCVWKIIYLLICIGYMEVIFSKSQLFNYIFLFGSIEKVNSSVLWFMYAYLSVMLFYPVTHFLFRSYEYGKKSVLYLLVILFFSGIIINEVDLLNERISLSLNMTKLDLNSMQQIIPFGNNKIMLFYFMLGGFLYKEEARIQEMLSKYRKICLIPIVMFVLGIIGLLLIKKQQTGSFLWLNIYLENGYGWCFTAFLAVGLYGMILFFSKKRKRSLMAYLGKNTMGIYYLHFPLLGYLSQTNLWNYLIEYRSFGLNMAKTIIITGVCVLVTFVLKRVWGLKILVK